MINLTCILTLLASEGGWKETREKKEKDNVRLEVRDSEGQSAVMHGAQGDT